MSDEAPKKVRPWDLLQKYVPGASPSRVSDEDAATRLAICDECPRLRKKTNRHGLKSTCEECNCFMPEKVKLAGAYCPLTPPKWNRVDV